MNTPTSPIKLAIVDDDKIISSLLKDYFTSNSAIDTILIANSGHQFLEHMATTSDMPDVILLDLQMKNGTGLDVLDAISKEQKPFKIIVISTYYDVNYIGQMLKLGCDAFLPKEVDPSELIDIIYTVSQKGSYFTEEQIHYIRKQISPKSPKLHIQTKNALSERELEVLGLLSQQLTTKEIAERMFLSPKTVEMHKSNLLLKTGTRNSIGLIIYAIQHQLINPDSLLLLGN